MNFVDRTLLRLTGPNLREQLFDEIALGQIASAAYDADQLSLSPPYAGVFDEMRLGLGVPNCARLEGRWAAPSGEALREAMFALRTYGTSTAVRVDALWRGAVVGRVAHAQARIESVETQIPSPAGIDAAIVADLGALPNSPPALETERRARYLARLKAASADANAANEAALDRILERLGVAGVGEWLSHPTGAANAVTIRFSAGPPPAPRPLALPISAALLVRDVAVSLSALLVETRMAREHLETEGFVRGSSGGLPLRHAIIVVWVLPPETFDDGDWPGAAAGLDQPAARTARRKEAGRWLSREGIGLVVPPP